MATHSPVEQPPQGGARDDAPEPTGATAAAPHDLSIHEALALSPTTGFGLCLSGGGYRAMLFHLGTLWRLNEAGWLPRLTMVSSVSGGSITSALLGAVWSRLGFGVDGVGTAFRQLVADPILDFADKRVDAPAVLLGLVTGGVSRRVEAAYDRALYHGARLRDLPDWDSGPAFYVLATDLNNGVMWRFTRRFMGSYRTQTVTDPDLPLARAVAASSAFPPFLSPVYVQLPDGTRATLTDGGVYDNMGIEPVLKNCATVLVSDAGGPFSVQKRPPTDWLMGTVRVLLTMQSDVGRRRTSEVMRALTSHRRAGALWRVNTVPSKFPGLSPGLAVTDSRADALSHAQTRLWPMPAGVKNGLVNWGYAAADAALRSWYDEDLPQPAGFPLPGGMGA